MSQTLTSDPPISEPSAAPRRTSFGRAALGAIQGCLRFLKTSYVDGSVALLRGRYSRGQAAIIIAGAIPGILGLLWLTVPSLLFPTPEHHEFYLFAHNVSKHPASLLPTVLGAISATLALRVPLS